MIVTLLTDYGSESEFAGVCHGVIRNIAPDSDIVDITHGIPKYDARQGAIVLSHAIPYMPVGVHLAIVDPQVGTERRALALRTGDERLLVGPDNGVLSLAWAECGGVSEVVDIGRSPHRLEPVSATFHGRDLFAPVAAALATGAELRNAGDALGAEELATIELPVPRVEGGVLSACVLSIDRYGNAALNVRHDQLPETGLTLGSGVEIEASGERFDAKFALTFADVKTGEVIVYEDAYRSLAIAINRGDASFALRLEPDSEVRLRPN